MANSPVRILLVEDQKLMRVGLKSLFEEHGELEIAAEAQSGKEAIEKYRTTHPDITLMDIGLPDMSGNKKNSRDRQQSQNRYLNFTSF